jgi:hypothetical protein
MIELKFGLFWAGKRLSYLRYLTFKSLRYWHPDSEISLYVANDYNSSNHKWNVEKQDFEGEDLSQPNYIDRLKDLNIKVINISSVGDSNYCAILQADLFRVLWLRDNGGFYLDTDQIVLKSFETLPLEKDFIYSRYMEPQCGDYFPTGILGASKGNRVAELALEKVMSTYSPYSYNSSGPFAFLKLAREYNFDKEFNAVNVPSQYFYPIHSSKDVSKIYEGLYNPIQDSYCVHFFGGHPMTQIFNKLYTEEYAKTSKDSITKIVNSFV